MSNLKDYELIYPAIRLVSLQPGVFTIVTLPRRKSFFAHILDELGRPSPREFLIHSVRVDTFASTVVYTLKLKDGSLRDYDYTDIELADRHKSKLFEGD